MQEKEEFTRLMVWQEEQKFYPFEDVWEEFCKGEQVPAGEEWLDVVERYERDVLVLRTASMI